MVKVEIDDITVDVKSGIGQKSGQPYEIRSQTGWMHTPDSKYPSEVKVTLDKDQAAYGKGMYELAGNSFYADKFKAIAVRPILLAIK